MRKIAFVFAWFFVFAIPWENVVLIPGIGTSAKFAGAAAIAISLFIILVKGNLKWHQFHLAGLLFVLWFWFTYFWSINPSLTRTRCITYTGLWLASVVLYQFAMNRENLLSFLNAYLLGAWVTVLNLIYQYLRGVQVGRFRYAAMGFDPNDVAFYINLAIPIAWYLSSFSKRKILKVITLGFILPASYAVFLTGSRSGAVGLILSLSFIILSLPRVRSIFKIAGLALAVSGGIFLYFIPRGTYSRILTLPRELSVGTLNERTVIWKAGLKAFAKSPFLGTGAGTFPDAIRPFINAKASPHNAFIGLAVEGGIIGVSLWIYLLFTVLLPVFGRAGGILLKFLWTILFLPLFLLNFEWRKATWFIMTISSVNYSGRE